MQGISPIFPVQKVEETDSLQSSFPLSASISQQVNYYGPPSHSSFPQPAFPHHSQNFQSTSLHPSLASQSTNLRPSLASQSTNLHPSLASQSTNLHPTLASLSASLKSTDFQTEVVASGSAPRKRGRPRKHVDPCQGGHTFTLLDVDIVSVISLLLVVGSRKDRKNTCKSATSPVSALPAGARSLHAAPTRVSPRGLRPNLHQAEPPGGSPPQPRRGQALPLLTARLFRLLRQVNSHVRAANEIFTIFREQGKPHDY